MHSKLSTTFILTAFAAVFAAPSCPNGAQPFEGTGRAATESKARENANSDIARLFSTIKVDIIDELTQRETNGDIKEYANYQRKIKVEGGLYAGYVKDTEYPYPKENGQFVAKRYLCPNDAAKPYLDSLKTINQRVAIQKVNNSFCESLYKTYSPRVILFERILDRLGETAQVADYKKAEKECDDLRGSIRKGFVGFEEALDKTVAEILSKVRGRTNIKIVIAEIYASPQKTSNFIAAELESRLVKVKAFAVVEPANVTFGEQEFKMSGPMKYADAMEIGRHSKANIVLVGSFDPYAGFSHFMIKALELPSTKTLAMYTDKVRPDDEVLSGLITDKLPAITEDALAYLNKGEDLYREGKYDEAIRELDRALAVNGNLYNAYFTRGAAYYGKNNYDRAIEDFNAALRIKPDFYEALNDRGLAYYDKGNYDRAIEDFTAALRIKPDFYKTLSNRGLAYVRKGNYDRAIEDYNTAIRIKPDYSDLLSNRGNVYAEKGSYDRAFEDLNAALRIKPDNYKALSNRGSVYYKKGNYERAIEDFTAALRIKPDFHLALYNRGTAYNKKGNDDKAIEDYSSALRINSDDSSALYNRGATYYSKGNYDRAIEDWEAVLRINQNHANAKKYIEIAKEKSSKTSQVPATPNLNDDYKTLYNLGLDYADKGNYDQAIAYYNAALRIKPDLHFALNNRGAAYYSKGNYDRAIEDWEAALRINPNNTEARNNIEFVRQEKAKKSPTPVPSGSATPAASSLKDTRDNKTYKIVKIGTQTWMAENLNYNANGSKCYDNQESNCQKYGRLYNWETAKSACPSGWHLPSKAEWDALMTAVGGEKTAGKVLKATSGWISNGNGQDKYGFSALPGGYGYSDGRFVTVGNNGDWWSATEDNSDYAYYRNMGYLIENASYNSTDKSDLLSVRCLQD